MDAASNFFTEAFDSEYASPAEWARMYHDHGVQVVPAYMPGEPSDGTTFKRPILEWKGLQKELISDAKFDEMYGPSGEYIKRENMGAVTGPASSNKFVIDLDTYKNDAAAQWWTGLMAVHNNGMEPETWEQKTGGGGRQLVFEAPADWKAPTNRTSIGVDVRGFGGFAMLPPSLHESGQHYEWVEGRAPWEIEIAKAPEWLLEAVENLVARYGSVGGGERTASPGEDFDAFGHRKDGREDYMFRLIWAAIVGWHIECPNPRSPAASAAKMEAVWADYERNVKSRRPAEDDVSNAELLERENRGHSMFNNKWRRTMLKWDAEVAKAAAERKAREEKEEGGGGGAQPSPGKDDDDDEFKVDPLPKLPWLDMSNWDHVPVPERKWAIRDRVPLNQAGLFSGEGGTGKSIVELMKDIAHVAAKDWFGSLPEPGPAFYLGAEDDTEEIHIRLAAIAKHYGVTFAELTKSGLHVLPLLGEDAVLCAANPRSGRVEVTDLYRQIYEAAGDLRPKNISIDTLSRAFAGNEIDRTQVYAFAMHMQALAKVASGSVTVLSHPSLAGMASGSGISGSTAWHGAFRFRQYLKGVNQDNKDEDGRPPDTNFRELEFKKNQYGPLGQSITLRYLDGLFLPVGGVSSFEKLAREAKVDRMFLDLLARFAGQGQNISHKKNSNNYAPTVFAEEREARVQNVSRGEFIDAMRRLFDAKKIRVETYGPPSKTYTNLVATVGSE
jgi:RecA-family ATPase